MKKSIRDIIELLLALPFIILMSSMLLYLIYGTITIIITGEFQRLFPLGYGDEITLMVVGMISLVLAFPFFINSKYKL